MCVRTLWLGLESTGRWGSYPSLRGVISERCCGRMKLRRCPTKRKTPRPRGCKGTLRHSAGVVARLCAVVESTRRAASYLPRDAYTLPVAESSSRLGAPLGEVARAAPAHRDRCHHVSVARGNWEERGKLRLWGVAAQLASSCHATENFAQNHSQSVRRSSSARECDADWLGRKSVSSPQAQVRTHSHLLARPHAPPARLHAAFPFSASTAAGGCRAQGAAAEGRAVGARQQRARGRGCSATIGGLPHGEGGGGAAVRRGLRVGPAVDSRVKACHGHSARVDCGPPR